MFKGTLNEVLFEIGKQLSLSYTDLVDYANEAPYAATRPDGNTWPSGTGSVSEKRILYAITRALCPALSLDLGTRWGAMALQIATGDRDAQVPKSKIYSVDIETTIFRGKHPTGKFLPKQFGVNLVHSDVIQYLKKDNRHYELIFEDTAHTYEITKAIYELAPERLVEGGVIISHDINPPKFKGAVVRGIQAAGIEPNTYLVEGDFCGLAIWQKPKRKLSVSITEAEQPMEDNAKTDTEAPKEKPKRRKRRRKKASKTVIVPVIPEGARIETIPYDE